MINSLFGTSWRTSVGGAMAAIGMILSQATEPAWAKAIGQILTALGTVLIGFTAQDSAATTPKKGR